MSIESDLADGLVECGLWPEEAATVVALFEQEDECRAVKFTDPDWTDYPPQLRAVLQMSVQGHAIRWLEEHHPMHFALGILKSMHGITT